MVRLAKECDIFFNNSAESFAVEIVKSLEELGKKVIDYSEEYYYTEDKWIFYLKCREHKIPTPNTTLLSENIKLAISEIRENFSWPVVLKRIEGTCGNYVELAKNEGEAKKIIGRFWKRGSERLPIIAQEFVKSPSYRVTLFDGKVVQAVVKKNKGWKATGVYSKKIAKFKID